MVNSWVDLFVGFIILIKIIFVISSVGYVILSYSTSDNANKYDSKLLYWKERTEFVFIISMSILLIYHFNPRFDKKPVVGDETALLFFLFGFVLILTAKWNLFIKEANWFKKIVRFFQ